MDIDEDLRRLARQEELLQFERFDAHTAWDLGSALVAAIGRRGAHAAVEIRLAGQLLFFYAMPGATPDNADWLRRKRNVVERFHTSSYAFKLSAEKAGHLIGERYGISHADYTASGGGFPLRVRGTGCVGFIGVSGLPQREDHGVIVEVLAACLGVPLAGLALDQA